MVVAAVGGSVPILEGRQAVEEKCCSRWGTLKLSLSLSLCFTWNRFLRTACKFDSTVLNIVWLPTVLRFRLKELNFILLMFARIHVEGLLMIRFVKFQLIFGVPIGYYVLITYIRLLLEKIVAQLVKEILHIAWNSKCIACSQDTTDGPCHDWVEATSHPYILFL